MEELILRAQKAVDEEDWEEYERVRFLIRKTYEGENNS